MTGEEYERDVSILNQSRLSGSAYKLAKPFSIDQLLDLMDEACHSSP